MFESSDWMAASFPLLLAVVLASLTTARSKGNDAAIQSELSNMRAQAELYYSSTGNGSYGADNIDCTAMFAAPTGLKTLVDDLKIKAGSGNVACTVAGTGASWAVSAKTSGGYWCSDSTGKSASSSSSVASGVCH